MIEADRIRMRAAAERAIGACLQPCIIGQTAPLSFRSNQSRKEKSEVDKAIAFEAIRTRIPDAWTLLAIVESTNPPDCIPNEGSDLTLTTPEGWQVSYFYDVGELDYIDEIRSPDGLVTDPWEWPMGAPGGSTLMTWRGVGDRSRLMAFRETKPIQTIDCTALRPDEAIAVTDQEHLGIDFGGTELIGGYLDWDARVIRRIPTQEALAA